jgi:signal transduction histidine kinase
MMELNNQPYFKLQRSLPYLVASIFICIALTCSLLLYFHEDLTNSLLIYFSGFILIAGIVIGTLSAYLVRQQQTAKQTLALLHLLTIESQKEVTKLKEAETSKQHLEKALLQGQKLQAIGTLAGGIAHDFNNILYAIKGYVDMAREDLDHNTLIHRNLGKVLEATDRGRELIAHILAFSRRQHLDYKPINLQTTIESALALLKPTIPSSINIELDFPKCDCIITGNQTQLHQVVVNIVNNAVDAMEGEGNINLKIQSINSTDPILKQLPSTTQKDMHYCRIDITDTGSGMDAHTVQRIFEPFYTTKEVGKGTGLGLSTVYSIISNHQGLITAHSQLGLGTTFTILLPMLTVGEEDAVNIQGKF